MKYNKKVVSVFSYIKYVLKTSFGGINIFLSKRRGISDMFRERLMLSVTEVVGCAYCSYAHAKKALKAGLSDSEISSILSNEKTVIKKEEALGIAYAISFAEESGIVSKDINLKLKTGYGRKKANTIKSLVNMISIGNTIGVSNSILKSKLNKQKVNESFFMREIIIYLTTIILIPFAIITFIIGIFFNL